MYSWAGNQMQAGGLYRVRSTGKPVHLPLTFATRRDGIALGFSAELDRNAAIAADDVAVKVWSLKRTENYGSPHLDERPLNVADARIGPDGRTLQLKIPGLKPTMGLEIRYRLRTQAGSLVEGVFHGTIHELADR
jgi:hypothetical protein